VTGRSPASKSGRREARERALALLYEVDTKGSTIDEVLAALPVPPDRFATEVTEGVERERDTLDELIARYSRGWTLHRMPVLDRVVLRMGTFELLHRPDVPAGVAIAEAVELAKRFSTDDSGRFVNGVLAAIAAEVRPGQTRPRPTGR